MKNIFITGASGFVGKNLIHSLSSKYKFIEFNRTNFDKINNCDVVIHLAGKAHDLKKTTNSKEYYEVNTELTKSIYNYFLQSNSKIFIYISSVKAVADIVETELTEDHLCNPITHYGKSKLLAEEYILSKNINKQQKIYILRPCMIHGPGNKGNLNLLYNLVIKGLPWPLGSFHNKRSFCSIQNLIFILNSLIVSTDIESGIYNISDDDSISTNEIISLIGESVNKNVKILNISRAFVFFFANLGTKLQLPFNAEILQKLTENYVVSNKKIKNSLGVNLPLDTKEGLRYTLASFRKNKF
jgi:nucleoside-diphosphate-sugar epimerase